MAKEGEVMNKLKELIDDNVYIWTPAEKIRAAEADLKAARDLARKYYEQNGIDRDYILQYQTELKEAQERIAELEESRFINQRASEAMRNMLFDYNKNWRELRRWQNYLAFLEREAEDALLRKPKSIRK